MTTTIDEHVMQVVEQRLAQGVTYATNMVAAKKWNETQARAYIEDLQVQAAKQVLGVEDKSGLSDDPRKGEPVSDDPITLYAASLKRQGTFNEKQILELVLAAQAAGVESVKEAADEERAAQQGQRDREATARYEATPEGIMEFAAAQRAADAAQASKVEDGKIILEARGIPRADIEGGKLADWEILKHSGIDPEAGPDNAPMSTSTMIAEGN